MRTNIRALIIIGLLFHFNFFVTQSLYSQDNLLGELEQMDDGDTQYTYATFKGTRAVNGHSVETKRQGELEFIIMHRFGRLNSGAYNFWGLDAAFIRIGLEYGLTDRLGIGIGRNSYKKIIDSYLKYKVLRQSEGANSFPFTVTALASTGLQTFPKAEMDSTLSFSDRFTHTFQLLIARKVSTKLSLQIAPTILHSNRVDETIQDKDQIAIGAAGRYKLTKSLSVNAEYYYRIEPNVNTPYYNSLALGFDIETGGHVFQLIFSNTRGMVERTFINETQGDFFEGDIHFGFNITRTFQLKK